MADTWSDIKNSIYFRIGVPNTDATYTEASIVLPEANRVQRMICRGKVKSVINDMTIKAWDLSFMREEAFFEIVPHTTLDGNITTASTSVDLTDSSSFASSWYVTANNDSFNYTSNSSNTLWTVTGIGRKHYDGDKVRQLYVLPSDYWKPIDLFYGDEKLDMRDPREGEPIYSQYWEAIDYSSSVKLMDIVGINGSTDVVRMVYIKDATDMTKDGSSTDLPDDYGTKVIAPIVAGNLLIQTEQAERGKMFLQQGYAELINMYKDFGELRREHRRVVRTSSMLKSVWWYDKYGDPL